MGLFDSVFTTFDNALGNLFNQSSPATSGTYLGGSDYGSPALYSVAQPAQPQYQMTMAAAPAIVEGGMMVARGLATRFPSLYASLVALAQTFGRKFTPEMVLRMLKTYGPQMVVGLIGAAAMNELMVWQTSHKRRRMNVANTRALRRSVRRLKGFDRLSHRVSAQLSRVGGSRRRSARRCGTCRKNPCSC